MFPQGYPSCPPKVLYRSYGYAINPNLYSTGKVCLSLLNTWFGRKSSEKWDPNTSTVLQVMLSLQALVLNEQPYFNEPIVKGLRRDSFHKKSYAYNENVFLLSCRTMVHVMNRPPMGFESFFKDHFRDRGDAILDACKAYFVGSVPVGQFGLSNDIGYPGIIHRHPSEKLRSGLLQVYPFLVKWFERCGVEVGESRVLSVSATEGIEKEGEASDKVRKYGRIMVVIGRVLGKVRRVMGLPKGGKKKD